MSEEVKHSSMKYSMSHRKHQLASDVSAATIPDVIRHWARTKPDEEAFVFVSTDRDREIVSWQQLHETCANYARSLRALGVTNGDVISIAVRASPTWLYATFGSMFAGAIPVPISFNLKDGSDVIAVLNKIATCTTFILDPDVEESAWDIVEGFLTSLKKDGSVGSDTIPSLKHLICTSAPVDQPNVFTTERLLKMAVEECELPVVHLDDVCILLRTSGSTGTPKVVVHTYKSVYFFSVITRQLYGKADIRWYNDRPLGFIGGWPFTVLTGDTRICLSGLSEPPEDWAAFVLDVFRKERCNCSLLLPPGLQHLMDKVNAVDGDIPLHTMCTGGQPVGKHFAQCIGKLCDRFATLYGSTECLLGLSIAADCQDDVIESCTGIPPEGTEVRIANDAGETVPVNVRREVYVKSVGMFAGYMNSQESTEAALTADGWYRTDDIGYMNEDGYFFVEGRKSDVILSGGMNVYPSGLESIIKSCSGVRSVGIVGIPDDVYFQVVCACVIRQPGNDITEDNLRKFCEAMHNDRPRLFTVLPTYYLFFDSFPLTRTGKTSRKDLTADAVRIIKAVKHDKVNPHH